MMNRRPGIRPFVVTGRTTGERRISNGNIVYIRREICYNDTVACLSGREHKEPITH